MKYVFLLLMIFTLTKRGYVSEVEVTSKEYIESYKFDLILNQEFDYDLVTATVYNAVEAQTNNDPSHTASMFKLDLNNPYKHRIIAVSRDLLKKYPLGTKVRITGTMYDGVYTVEDKMNKRYVRRIDILINEDMPIGKWTSIKIVKLN